MYFIEKISKIYHGQLDCSYFGHCRAAHSNCNMLRRLDVLYKKIFATMQSNFNKNSCFSSISFIKHFF